MSDGAHLLIPFAACSAQGCRQALQGLALPRLATLLARLAPVAVDGADEMTLSTPPERVLARECGLSAADGRIPWAAWQLQQAGRDPGGKAWAWITPCHWRVATDHITLSQPQELQLDAQASQALLAAMRPFFEQDGIGIEYHAPMLWLASGEVFRPLASASLDRVVGRSIDAWMPRAPKAAPLRRLQQEMQLLLYTHPINDQRVRDGLLPVNSFWVSGSGALPASHGPAPPPGLQIAHGLREPALLEDWPAWAAAWQQLDARECGQLLGALDQGRAVTLTLCGDRSARTWSGRQTGLWPRFMSVFSRKPASIELEKL